MIKESKDKKVDKSDSKQKIIDISKYPEKYIEINIIKKDNFRMVDTIYKFINEKNFTYEDKEYAIDSKCIFIIPSRKSFLQSSYYIEGIGKPLDFVNKNVGIPCNALSLLWNYRLYKALMQLDEKNINFVLIILLLASMIMYGVGLYFHYGGSF